MQLEVLPGKFAVCRLSADAEFPHPQAHVVLWSLTRSASELSLVCSDAGVPETCLAVERDWRALVVVGPLDFSLVGILASLAGTLAEADISLFAISTFDTDYLLVKARTLEKAISALEEAGNSVTFKELETE